MLHIVFVCTGNICRSPMAEGLMRHKWREMGRNDLVVSSMGIHGLNDFPATDYARKVCEENGFDISSHSARSLVADELQKADLILCMESVHKKFIQTFFPGFATKSFFLAPGREKEPVKAPLLIPWADHMKNTRKFSVLLNTTLNA